MEKQDAYTEAYSLRFSRELREELERLAREDDRTLANYIRRVLENHVSSINKKEAAA